MPRSIILLLLLSKFSFSQPLIEHAFRNHGNEQALSFIKYNTFTYIISRSSPYDAPGLRVKGINNDGSIRFDKKVYNSYPIYFLINLFQCYPTPDKGMIIVNSGYFCVTNNHPYTYTKIDSTGTVTFSLSTLGTTGGFGAVSNTFYFGSLDNNLVRIDPTTGIATATLHTASDPITVCTSGLNKSIVYSNSISINVVDTLGTTVATSFFTSALLPMKIKTHNSKYYLLYENLKTLQVRDSLLNSIAAVSFSTGQVIDDYDLFNDTLYVSLFDSNINRSIIKTYGATLTPITSNTIGITEHRLVGLIKYNNYHFLTQENAGKIHSAAAPYAYSTGTISNLGYSSFTSLSSISYPSDLVLKAIKPVSCTFSGYNTMYNYYDYDYVNKLVIFNNSNDTVKKFKVNHARYLYHALGGCNNPLEPYKSPYDATFIQTILPMDSIELQMPMHHGSNSLTATSNSLGISHYYCVSLPNDKLDNVPANNERSLNVLYLNDVGSVENDGQKALLVYPNPANRTLFFSSVISRATVYDVRGRTLISCSNSSNMDVSELECGLYLISLEVNGATMTRKFVKSSGN